MKIAIPSGKGGTGKTTVASNLAMLAARSGLRTTYVDCDVEEPNGHIFLAPTISDRQPVAVLFPLVDESACTYCGACADICQYSAVACLGKYILVYPELCHACGGCRLVCAPAAISEVPREIGQVESGHAGPLRFVQGRLNIGEPMSPPVIRAVKERATDGDGGGDGLVVLDVPPGTSCPVVESLRGCDFALLVTEPTPFGLNDLRLAVDMVEALGIPFGVVLNRVGVGDGRTEQYCAERGIRILGRIPDDRRIASAYSRGRLIIDELPEYAACFAELLREVGSVACVSWW